MAHNYIDFRHKISGQRRIAPVGFAWDVLLTGPFAFLYRKEWAWFGVMLALTLLTLYLSNIVLAFKVNRFYINWLVANDYKVQRVKNGSVDRLADQLDMNLPTTRSVLFNETRVVRR
jgi:hypothetical protein